MNGVTSPRDDEQATVWQGCNSSLGSNGPQGGVQQRIGSYDKGGGLDVA
jgi:hypothetical protein